MNDVGQDLTMLMIDYVDSDCSDDMDGDGDGSND